MAVHVGSSVDKTANVYATSGALANPDLMRVVLKAPDRSQEVFVYPDPLIENPSTGVWIFTTPPLDQVGTWWVAFIASGGDVTVTDEQSQEVCGLHVALPV